MTITQQVRLDDNKLLD
jgi:hypothetical protein